MNRNVSQCKQIEDHHQCNGQNKRIKNGLRLWYETFLLSLTYLFQPKHNHLISHFGVLVSSWYIFIAINHNNIGRKLQREVNVEKCYFIFLSCRHVSLKNSLFPRSYLLIIMFKDRIKVANRLIRYSVNVLTITNRSLFNIMIQKNTEQDDFGGRPPGI